MDKYKIYDNNNEVFFDYEAFSLNDIKIILEDIRDVRDGDYTIYKECR